MRRPAFHSCECCPIHAHTRTHTTVQRQSIPRQNRFFFSLRARHAKKGWWADIFELNWCVTHRVRKALCRASFYFLFSFSSYVILPHNGIESCRNFRFGKCSPNIFQLMHWWFQMRALNLSTKISTISARTREITISSNSCCLCENSEEK